MPNEHGGRENLEAVAFLRELNEVLHAREPGVAVVAEESTAWPRRLAADLDGRARVHVQVEHGLDARHALLRRARAGAPTVPPRRADVLALYAWDENFVLPLSHDEVVHGKRSLLSKLPGDRWQKLATLRALYGLMWAHPGKQLLFMGGELARVGRVVREPLARLAAARRSGPCRRPGARARPQRHLPDAAGALGGRLPPEGFVWLVGDARDENVIAFARFAADGSPLVCAVNFSPSCGRAGGCRCPRGGRWRRGAQHRLALLRAAPMSATASGSRRTHRRSTGSRSRPLVTLPPLATIWLAPGKGGGGSARGGSSRLTRSATPSERGARAPHDPALRSSLPRSSSSRATSSAESSLRSRRSNPITTSSSRHAGRGPPRSARRQRRAGSRVLAPADEAELLEPVEVTRQRRPLDPDGGGEVVLRAPGADLQVREHEPRRNRAAGARRGLRRRRGGRPWRSWKSRSPIGVEVGRIAAPYR